MDYPILQVKPGSEIHVQNRHHAIFKPSIVAMPKVDQGAIVEVQASDGSFLCYATVNIRSYLCARSFAFEKSDPMVQLRRLIKRAVELRNTLFASGDTEALRLINAEGDAVPGLIVDRYRDTLVVQLTSAGMDKLRPWIAELLAELCPGTVIYEKSTGPARIKEGMPERQGWMHGKGEETLTVSERGLKFEISISGSQKTGLFLDQREMRSLVSQHSAGRTVLDCCSYVGGFALSALRGGAIAADCVDYDSEAIARCAEHMALNGFSTDQYAAYDEDVFDFLRRKPLPRTYDFIVLDPPAFAKRSTDLSLAQHTYTDLNRLALQALPAGSLLLTCSCSYQVDMALFQTIVFHAAKDAGRFVRILQRHHHAYDHPVNVYHPEVDYLKSMLLWVE